MDHRDRSYYNNFNRSVPMHQFYPEHPDPTRAGSQSYPPRQPPVHPDQQPPSRGGHYPHPPPAHENTPFVYRLETKLVKVYLDPEQDRNFETEVDRIPDSLIPVVRMMESLATQRAAVRATIHPDPTLGLVFPTEPSAFRPAGPASVDITVGSSSNVTMPAGLERLRIPTAEDGHIDLSL